MKTNQTLAKVFTKVLKEDAAKFNGTFADLISATLVNPAIVAKQKEIDTLAETNAQLEALRAQKRSLLAASRPAVTLDAKGNPVKRGPGRPRKNPLPVASSTPAKKRGRPAKVAPVVIPDAK